MAILPPQSVPCTTSGCLRSGQTHCSSGVQPTLKAGKSDGDVSTAVMKADKTDMDVPTAEVKAGKTDMDVPTAEVKAGKTDMDVPTAEVKADKSDMDYSTVGFFFFFKALYEINAMILRTTSCGFSQPSDYRVPGMEEEEEEEEEKMKKK